MKNYECLQKLETEEREQKLGELGYSEKAAKQLSNLIDIFPPCKGMCYWRGISDPSVCDDYRLGNCVLCRGVFRWLMSETIDEGENAPPPVDTRVVQKVIEAFVLRNASIEV